MKPSSGFIKTIVVISLHLVDAFITPSGSEPECPGITCPLNKIIDTETCLCVCQDICLEERSVETDWPRGKYGLPASIYGCPEPQWTQLFIEIILRNDSVFWESKRPSEFGESYIYEHTNKELHILGPYFKRLLAFNICAKEDGEGGSYASWPKGNYCIFKTRNKCPTGFNRRNLVITEIDRSSIHGDFPAWNVGSKHVKIFLCCTNDDDTGADDFTIPSNFPFVLIKKSSSRKCPSHIDDVLEETVFLPKYIFNLELSDMLSDLTTTENHVGLTFCSYIPKLFMRIF